MAWDKTSNRMLLAMRYRPGEQRECLVWRDICDIYVLSNIDRAHSFVD